MKLDCKKEVSNCQECLKFNVRRVGFHLISSVTTQLPFDHIAIDLIGLLTISNEGYNLILLVVDILTRFVLLKLV
jgi:hypothetical protein